MKKRILIVIVAAVLLAAGAVGGYAQLRLDADINVPIYLGYSSGGVSDGVWNQYFIPFPDVQLIYQFALGPVRLGPGVRVFTVIIENFLYPEIVAELELQPFVISAGIGGFALLEFGLITSLLQGVGINSLTGFHDVLLSDIGVQYKVNDWFRVCGGLYVISPFSNSLGGVLANNVFAGYINAKFTTQFK